MVEQGPYKAEVAGSNPAARTKIKYLFMIFYFCDFGVKRICSPNCDDRREEAMPSGNSFESIRAHRNGRVAQLVRASR